MVFQNNAPGIILSFAHQSCATGTLILPKDIYPRKYRQIFTILFFNAYLILTKKVKISEYRFCFYKAAPRIMKKSMASKQAMFLEELYDIRPEAFLVEPGGLLREAVEVREGFHNLTRYGPCGLLVRRRDETVVLLVVDLESTGIDSIIISERVVKIAQTTMLDKSRSWNRRETLKTWYGFYRLAYYPIMIDHMIISIFQTVLQKIRDVLHT